MGEGDPFRLSRFVDAQGGGVWERALAEVKAGAKRGHWMWFVFPQLAGLGFSETARFYAISGEAEARAYLAHPLLGGRLREATAALLGPDLPDDPEAVFGSVDALKLRSSLTLFDAVGGPQEPFGRALARLYEGADARTLELLSG